MNPMSSTSHGWPTGQDDDFASFLDFSDLNFANFNEAHAQGLVDSGSVAHRSSAVTSMDLSASPTPDLLELDPSCQVSQSSALLALQEPMNSLQNFTNACADVDPAMFMHARQSEAQAQQKRQLQTQYRAPCIVPPTPNSVEMQAGQVPYFQPTNETQQLYEHYRQQHHIDQANFTPLVSPAVTPVDTQFRYSDYAPSVESFSPLTSPALRAQNHNSHTSMYGNIRGSETPDTSSPVDFNLDHTLPIASSCSTPIGKPRRRVSSSGTKPPVRAVRQSPAMKAQTKRRQPGSAVIPAKDIQNILQEVAELYDSPVLSSSAGPRSVACTMPDASSTDSVSPEPLSEILMPPPASSRVHSAVQSPYLKPQQGRSQPSTAIDSPATPASLMQIRRQNERARSTTVLHARVLPPSRLDIGDLDDVSAYSGSGHNLDPRDLDGSGIAHTNARGNTSAARTPTSTLSSSSTPKLGTTSPRSITSPSISALEKRSDVKAGRSRESRTRTGNPSSAKASPALRPRISPSIQPLLPGGMQVSAETSALLLATKSNYQNILEGTRFPGVSYPENLTTNLTSKRTSHKIAEQGRRNRINTALQEIAALLPPTPTLAMNKAGSSDESTANGHDPTTSTTTAQQQLSNSKASTVEAAIEYIRSLQSEVRQCHEKLAIYEPGNKPTLKQSPPGANVTSIRDITMGNTPDAANGNTTSSDQSPRPDGHEGSNSSTSAATPSDDNRGPKSPSKNVPAGVGTEGG